MRNGLSVAMELLEDGMEGELKKVTSSRLFWLYSLSLFVPSAFRKIVIWLAGAELASAITYFLLAPATTLNNWTLVPFFLAASAIIWLVYGWIVFLGERASLTNVRVRIKILFKVIRHGKSFNDLTPKELRSLFPEPKAPVADVTIEHFLGTERLLRWIGTFSFLLMFVFDAVWISGAAHQYVPLLEWAPPGSVNAMWLWFFSLMVFIAPMIAYVPIRRRMAKRIRVNDRAKFAMLMKNRERRELTIHDVKLSELKETIQSGEIEGYLASKHLFRKIGFLSWWKEEELGVALLILAGVTAVTWAGVFGSTGLVGSALGFPLAIFGSITIALFITMALMGIDILIDHEKRVLAEGTRRIVASLGKGGIPFCFAEENEVAKVYAKIVDEGEQEPVDSSEPSLTDAAKPFAVVGALLISTVLVAIIAAYLVHIINLGHVEWLAVFAGAAMLLVAIDVLKLIRTKVSGVAYAELEIWLALKTLTRKRRVGRFCLKKNHEQGSMYECQTNFN